MAYTAEQLRTIFQKKFNLNEWTRFLTNFIEAKTIRQVPEQLELDPSEGKGYYLGQKTTTDNYEIGLFYIQTNSSVTNRRVGLRQIVKPYLRYLVDAALVVFDDGSNWRLSFVCDIKGESTSPKRYTFVFGECDNYYNTAVSRFSDLQHKGVNFTNLKEAFSVEALSKDFYTKLYSWYQWALSAELNVTFPNNPETEKDDRENMNVKLIRLITRLLFVWFIKQKDLVPNYIFDIAQLKKILVDFDPYATDNGNYYNAILQNLFFATLNCAIIDEEGNSRQFAAAKSARDTRNLYRYAEMFNISEDDVVKLFAKVPFLNGGLFECLDKPKGLYLKQEYDVLYDGFSRNGTRSPNGNLKYRAFIPNILFFNDDEIHPGLINLLNQYNFTIEENSPTDAVVSLDPELLGRVFENLLADFNEETHESARKSTGSFYTPREIVDYMVDESIKNYLLGKNNLDIDANSLNELFVKKNIPTNWNTSTCNDVADALRNIKILDPACGSGAFPMGCLHRIVELQEILCKGKIDRYSLKLAIIENCVYGVDIQPIAMLICKLRFFISLICEQTNVDFNSPETNFGINTLPNLETKFVAANSLISADIRSYENDWTADEKLSQLKEELLNIRNEHFLAKGRKAKRQSQRMDEAKREEIMNYIVKHSTQPDASVISILEKEVERLRVNLQEYEKEVWVDKTRPAEVTLFGVVESPDAIFREDINKKKRDELNAQIHSLENTIKKEKNKGEIVGFEAAVKQITEWNPYDQNSVSTFFDPEWMFCLKGKFDVVIGNPPYIQLQNNGGELAQLYEGCGYSTFARTGDIYCLFYERGWQLLKKNGHLCYITSNKWMRAGYGEKTRGFFANNTNPMLLIDFAGVKIFESATVDTNILLFSKSNNQHETVCAVTNKQNKDSVKNLSDFVQQQNVICNFSTSDSWVILSPIEQSIKRKIETVGTPLKDWNIQINYGIKTGFNDAFIISTEKREEILANCQTEDERKRTAELIRPILRGRDIKRYGYEWANLWLIYIPWHFPYQFDDSIQGASEKAERAFKEQYPAVYSHMLQYKEPLSKRNKAETGIRYEWYAMQRWGAKYWEDFNKPKIIWKRIGSILRFSFDVKGCLGLDSTCFATGEHIGYLCCVLNSLMGHYLLKDSPKTGTGDLLISVQAIEPAYIPYDSQHEIQLSKLLDKQIVSPSDVTEKEINNIVFAMYGLSPKEREYVTSYIRQSQQSQ